MSGPVRVADTAGPADTPGATGSPRITGMLGTAEPPAFGTAGATATATATAPAITGASGPAAPSSFVDVSGTSCACDTAGTMTSSEPRPQAVSPVSIGRPSTTPHPDRPPVRERWHLFAPDSSSVPRARHMTRDCLEGWGLQEHSHVAELLVSELVTNALRHSGGAIRLALFFADGMLRGEVEDADPSLPRVCQARDEDERGRGMYLLELLSCCWGSARTAKGKTVWFELTAHPARG